jgi:hypothetical protein
VVATHLQATTEYAYTSVHACRCCSTCVRVLRGAQCYHVCHAATHPGDKQHALHQQV